ncbi:MAG: aminotransferase class IV [Rhodospirillales bacterium]|jgi:branched-chain amino acid aminotransferase|nr:aminotransferase class IV [Rhodospirillales bacterium]
MTIWLDGALTTLDAARLRADDRGFTLGDGLFETLAVRDGVVLRAAAHLARLRSGCTELGLPLGHADDALTEALAQVAAGMQTGTLRLTVSRGPAPRGLRPPAAPSPTVLVTAAPAPLVPPAPATVVIAATTRRNEHSPLSRLKSLNYLDGVIAWMEASRRGADDALLLNTRGAVAEATAANLFAVIDGVAVTPPVADGALPGLMRAAVRDLLDAEERSLTPADLDAASEFFLTNVSGIRPVVRLDGRPVGRGRPGPVWASLGGLILGRQRP